MCRAHHNLASTVISDRLRVTILHHVIAAVPAAGGGGYTAVPNVSGDDIENSAGAI